jgi:hypothetical protein
MAMSDDQDIFKQARDDYRAARYPGDLADDVLASRSAQTRRRSAWPRLALAASVLIGIAAGSYTLLRSFSGEFNKPQSPIATHTSGPNDINAGPTESAVAANNDSTDVVDESADEDTSFSVVPSVDSIVPSFSSVVPSYEQVAWSDVPTMPSPDAWYEASQTQTTTNETEVQ